MPYRFVAAKTEHLWGIAPVWVMPEEQVQVSDSEISGLAHQLRLGDKTIEEDYVLTWMLVTLADSPQ